MSKKDKLNMHRVPIQQQRNMAYLFYNVAEKIASLLQTSSIVLRWVSSGTVIFIIQLEGISVECVLYS